MSQGGQKVTGEKLTYHILIGINQPNFREPCQDFWLNCWLELGLSLLYTFLQLNCFMLMVGMKNSVSYSSILYGCHLFYARDTYFPEILLGKQKLKSWSFIPPLFLHRQDPFCDQRQREPDATSAFALGLTLATKGPCTGCGEGHVLQPHQPCPLLLHLEVVLAAQGLGSHWDIDAA